jgi:hypothetical protein
MRNFRSLVLGLMLVSLSPLGWGEDNAWCEGFFLTPSQTADELEELGCVEGDRLYIKNLSTPEAADKLMLSLCKFDGGFTKLNRGYTCLYRGKRRSVKKDQ